MMDMTPPVTVILADGALPTHPVALALFRNAAHLVVCDGALAKARSLAREPDLAVGDGDSLPPNERRALGARWVQVDEQDTNDLEKAFREAVKRYGGAGVTVLGAEGMREDHFLGNVFRLPEMAKAAPGIRMVTNVGCFEVVEGKRSFVCRKGEPVSVFAPMPDTKVVSTGLVWPLAGVTLNALWRGTLNRTAAETFTLETDKPILVYMKHEE